MIRSQGSRCGPGVLPRPGRVRVRLAASRSASGGLCQQALRENKKSPELLLVGYFVTAAGADKDMVFQICDSAPSCYRELKIIDEPPQ